MNENNAKPRRDVRDPTDEELRTAVPRTQRHSEFRVGIFVLVGMAAVLLALFLLTNPSTFRGRYRITTTVEDAGGIRRGDPVQMRGVNIGRVLGFSLTPQGVRITLEIEGEWKIPADSHTRLVSSGILGGRTVEVVEGRSSTVLEGGDAIPGTNVAGLLDVPAELGKDAQDVLQRIQALLAPPTVDAVQSSAEELQTLLAQLSRLTRDQGAEIARLTASLNRSAEGIEEAAAAGGDVAQAVARADSALSLVNRTSDVLLRVSTSLETILARIEAGEGTLGQLSTNAALYETLTQTVESIRLLATDLREHPDRYVKIRIF